MPVSSSPTRISEGSPRISFHCSGAFEGPVRSYFSRRQAEYGFGEYGFKTPNSVIFSGLKKTRPSRFLLLKILECSFGLVNGQFLPFRWSFTCQTMAVNARNRANTTKFKSDVLETLVTLMLDFLVLTKLRGENSVSSSQPIICVPKRTH